MKIYVVAALAFAASAQSADPRRMRTQKNHLSTERSRRAQEMCSGICSGDGQEIGNKDRNVTLVVDGSEITTTCEQANEEAKKLFANNDCREAIETLVDQGCACIEPFDPSLGLGSMSMPQTTNPTETASTVAASTTIAATVLPTLTGEPAVEITTAVPPAMMCSGICTGEGEEIDNTEFEITFSDPSTGEMITATCEEANQGLMALAASDPLCEAGKTGLIAFGCACIKEYDPTLGMSMYPTWVMSMSMSSLIMTTDMPVEGPPTMPTPPTGGTPTPPTTSLSTQDVSG